MSGGADGLRGYIYQQQYVAFKVLSSLAISKLEGYQPARYVDTFSIEGRNSPDGSAWDVCIHIAGGEVHLRECKDTRITKTDRKQFYLRVRKELTTVASASKLSVGWVTDPDKQSGSILDHFRHMALLAKESVPPIPCCAPESVNSPEAAFDEALYYLCASDSCRDTPPCSVKIASDVLSRLEVDTCRLDELTDAVRLLVAGAFEAGTGDAVVKQIVGELSITIADNREARYSTGQLLQAAEIASVVIKASRELRDLLTYHSAAGFVPDIPSICWTQLDGTPKKEWALAERLSGDARGSCMLVAPIGYGKTVASQQMFREQATRLNPNHVLRVEAAALSSEATKAILPLACMLSGVARTWLAIDGIDEIKTSERAGWTQLISRLLRLPNLCLVVTARKEVVAAHSWLQQIAVSLREVQACPLKKEQVCAEFCRVRLPIPSNASLLEALCNPLLLSVYARIVTVGNMPLANSGEVTAFRVVEEFWRRAVGSVSVGHRAVGDEEESQSVKRAAMKGVVSETMAGKFALDVSAWQGDAASGVEMACREGLLIRQGTYSVRWLHDWVREFAIIDYLIREIERPGVDSLIAAIASVEVDHVGRAAAVAGMKWLLSHHEWGAVEDYAIKLHATLPGHAQDVVAVLMEGDANLIDLKRLPGELIIECVRQARLLKAKQWWQQVASLPDDMVVGGGGDLQVALTEYETEVEQWA